MKIGSLCSGYGGLEEGVRAVLGGEVAWHSEYEPPSKATPRPTQAAARVLAHRYPGVPNHGDMTSIDWSAVEPVDVLTGGTPCQDLSHAGKRGGMNEGTRSNLWVSMRNAIAQLRPSLVVWENVRGAYSACADSELGSCPGCVGDGPHRPLLRAVGRVLGDLSELGFDAEWVGIRASDIGAPHERFRVFVAAWPADSDGPRLEGGGPGRHGSEQPEPFRLASPSADRQDDGWKRARRARYGRSGPADCGDGPTADSHGHAVRLESVPESGGGSAPVSGHAGVEWGIYESAIRRWERLTRPAPLPFMKNRNGDPQLAPAFAEWMQGLPAGWVTDVPGLTRNEQLKALGNGVVPQQAAQALRMLLPDVTEAAA